MGGNHGDDVAVRVWQSGKTTKSVNRTYGKLSQLYNMPRLRNNNCHQPSKCSVNARHSSVALVGEWCSAEGGFCVLLNTRRGTSSRTIEKGAMSPCV